MNLARQVLWWQSASAPLPDASEALMRMRKLAENDGRPTPDAFTLQATFPPAAAESPSGPSHGEDT